MTTQPGWEPRPGPTRGRPLGERPEGRPAAGRTTPRAAAQARHGRGPGTAGPARTVGRPGRAEPRGADPRSGSGGAGPTTGEEVVPARRARRGNAPVTARPEDPDGRRCAGSAPCPPGTPCWRWSADRGRDHRHAGGRQRARVPAQPVHHRRRGRRDAGVPRSVYLIFPLPALVFVGAVITGKIHDSSLSSSAAGLAAGFTQSIAGIFFPMCAATIGVLVIGGARWLLSRQLVGGQFPMSENRPKCRPRAPALARTPTRGPTEPDQERPGPRVRARPRGPAPTEPVALDRPATIATRGTIPGPRPTPARPPTAGRRQTGERPPRPGPAASHSAPAPAATRARPGPWRPARPAPACVRSALPPGRRRDPWDQR